MLKIHDTAIVSSKAKLGENVEVGPYAIIHADVEIGDDTIIGPHSVVYDGARIGKRVKFSQGCSVSNLPQDLKFSDEKSLFYVGDDTVIREFCTLHRGTIDNGFSKIGKNCLLMAYAHVAHDCIVGDNVIIANAVQLGGHVVIEDWAILGGLVPVHQFVRIGGHSMIGGGFRTTVDIPPYVIAAGTPVKFAGVNVIGLRRRGFSNEDIATIKDAFMILYKSGLNQSQAKVKMKGKYPNHPNVEIILEFLSKVKRTGFK